MVLAFTRLGVGVGVSVVIGVVVVDFVGIDSFGLR